jgi:hypothetical protein
VNSMLYLSLFFFFLFLFFSDLLKATLII